MKSLFDPITGPNPPQIHVQEPKLGRKVSAANDWPKSLSGNAPFFCGLGRDEAARLPYGPSASNAPATHRRK